MSVTSNKNKILMIAPQTNSLVIFRGDLIKDVRKRGYDVTVVVPEDDYRGFFEKNGVKVRLISLDKNSFSILNTTNYYKCLRKIIEEEKPDKVFSYTIKPVIFGSLAAHKAGVKEIYSLICGLGMLFCSNSLKVKMVRSGVGVLYKRALKYNTRVIFQNIDDVKEFVKRGYVQKKQCCLVSGSGVNMKKFARNELPDGNVSFLMVSRVLKEKGVMEYLKAASIVKNQHPEVSFRYIGPIDKNKNALSLNAIKPYVEDGTVDYIAKTDDVAKYISQCHVFVLPSYYREGIPKTLLEATAMGRPIITTNTPGCKETVIEGENGLFVQVKRANDLAKKMIWMIEHRNKLQKMGDKSYELCLERFTIEKINHRMMEIMEVR